MCQSTKHSTDRLPFQSPMPIPVPPDPEIDVEEDDEDFDSSDLGSMRQEYHRRISCSWLVNGTVEVYNRNDNSWVCQQKHFRGPAPKNKEVLFVCDGYTHVGLDFIDTDFLLSMVMREDSKLPPNEGALVLPGRYWLERIDGPRIRVRLDSSRKLYTMLQLMEIFWQEPLWACSFKDLTGVAWDDTNLAIFAENLLVDFSYENIKLCPAGRGYGKTEFTIKFYFKLNNLTYNGDPVCVAVGDADNLTHTLAWLWECMLDYDKDAPVPDNCALVRPTARSLYDTYRYYAREHMRDDPSDYTKFANACARIQFLHDFRQQWYDNRKANK